MKRKNRYDYDSYDPPSSRGYASATEKKLFDPTKIAIIASVFILGIVVGIALNLGTNSDPTRIESRSQIDMQAPNAELCQQYGASAIVANMRVFLTLNPFNVFVTQPTMQPGCVLRQNNWSILEQQKLVNNDQVRDCKRRMNTFAFTGVLESSPNIDCVYQNDAAGNLFLNKPGTSGARPESDSF